MNKSATIAYQIGKIIITLKSNSEEGLKDDHSEKLHRALMQVPGFNNKDWSDLKRYRSRKVQNGDINLQFEILNNLLFNVYEVSYALNILHSYYNKIETISESDFNLIKLLNDQILGNRDNYEQALSKFMNLSQDDSFDCYLETA